MTTRPMFGIRRPFAPQPVVPPLVVADAATDTPGSGTATGQTEPPLTTRETLAIVEAPAPVVAPTRPGREAEVAAPEALYAVTQPVYSGVSRILGWSHNGRTGMTAKLRLDGVEAGAPHPFRGMRWNARAADGQRFRMVLSRLDPEGDVNLFTGEGMLSWWAEDCAAGQQVTLRLDSSVDGADARHPLAGMAQGARDGDVVFLACWVIGDDELPQPPGAAKQPPRPSFAQMDATRQAAIKCSDPEFRRWCRVESPRLLSVDEVSRLPPWSDQAAFTAEVVRLFCRVSSRSDLRQDTPEGQAGRGYWAEMMRRYNAWRRDEPPLPGE